MIKPSVIIRTNRRSLTLTIDKNGELIVKAPKRLSVEDILKFVKQKEEWISKKQNLVKTNLNKNQKIINYEVMLFCGKQYKKVYVDNQKRVDIEDALFIVPNNLNSEKEIFQIKKWYIEMTKQILDLRVNYFANLMQVNYDGLGVDNCKTRWGSCSKSGVIKFNLRLAMLPHKVIDYIIIHELSHLIEFNHSKNFYNIISSIMPDWQTQRNKLKEYGFLLSLLR